jgi:hypothetical protein
MGFWIFHLQVKNLGALPVYLVFARMRGVTLLTGNSFPVLPKAL